MASSLSRFPGHHYVMGTDSNNHFPLLEIFTSVTGLGVPPVTRIGEAEQLTQGDVYDTDNDGKNGCENIYKLHSY